MFKSKKKKNGQDCKCKDKSCDCKNPRKSKKKNFLGKIFKKTFLIFTVIALINTVKSRLWQKNK